MRTLCFFLFLFWLHELFAADSLLIMQYNLLNYGQEVNYCVGSPHSLTEKNVYLKQILSYVKPDIFACNEVYSSSPVQDSLTNLVISLPHISYKRASYTYSSAQALSSMLFYNQKKLRLCSVSRIQDEVRDVYVYRFALYAPSTDERDSLYLTCLTVHLKAGNTASDERKRASTARKIKEWIDSSPHRNENCIIMGDLNLYSNQEEAFQILCDSHSSYRFYDPVGAEGNWHDNPLYAHLHSQSTHANDPCFATGGLDDRFDFILINQTIKNRSSGLSYLNHSYEVLGNKGKNFNLPFAYETGSFLPSAVSYSLYRNSDHLPVSMRLLIHRDPERNSSLEIVEGITFSYQNPIKDVVKLCIHSEQNTHLFFSLYTLSGEAYMKDITVLIREGTQHVEIPLPSLRTGIYLCFIRTRESAAKCIKIMKRR